MDKLNSVLLNKIDNAAGKENSNSENKKTDEQQNEKNNQVIKNSNDKKSTDSSNSNLESVSEMKLTQDYDSNIRKTEPSKGNHNDSDSSLNEKMPETEDADDSNCKKTEGNTDTNFKENIKTAADKNIDPTADLEEKEPKNSDEGLAADRDNLKFKDKNNTNECMQESNKEEESKIPLSQTELTEIEETGCDKVQSPIKRIASLDLSDNLKEENQSKKSEDLVDSLTAKQNLCNKTQLNKDANSENKDEQQNVDRNGPHLNAKIDENTISEDKLEISELSSRSKTPENSSEDSRISTKSEQLGLPSPTCPDENEENVKSKIEYATKEQEVDENGETDTIHNYETTSALNEDDSEAEFENVEIPEEEHELIVPDEGVNTQNEDHADNDSVDGDFNKCDEPEPEPYMVEDDTSNSKFPEDDESSQHGQAEPELVAINQSRKDSPCSGDDEQTTNDTEVESNNVVNDPLNCSEANQQPNEETNENGRLYLEKEDTSSDAYQEDDDDVEFVETRNSPICIESDEEDEDSRITETSDGTNTITVSTATITIPKSLTVTRTSARKSTARPQSSASSSPQTVPQSVGVKGKRFTYLDKATTYTGRRSVPSILSIIPQQVVDTIEVLDSSDEDSTTISKRQSSTQNLRTPPKRTLMAAKESNKQNVPCKASFVKRGVGLAGQHLAPQIRQQPRKPAPPPLPPATPQSNFLNNFCLQPATSGTNPPAFSALLSNKSVIIPNAFYGNHPSMRANVSDGDLERRYVRWLDSFITQFSNPQLVASQSCFDLLQCAIRYKDFIRIKGIRTTLNMNAQKATNHLHHQLMLDLRTILLKGSNMITPFGRRLCEIACSKPQNKTLNLLIHAVTGRVIMRTCNMEVATASSSSASTSTNHSFTATARKRQLEEDEYVPVKNKLKSSRDSNASENGEDDDSSKRSLRSKRAKRIDDSFSYNEDDLAEYDLDDEEEAEKAVQAEIQRKIDDKRQEAQRQRQQQAKSFESEFIQAFAKSIDGRDVIIRNNKDKPPVTNKTKTTAQRARISSSMPVIQQHLAHNDAEDLLQATWIENVENEETQVISDDEEPRQHLIYKQLEKKQNKHKTQMQQQLQRSVATKHLSSNAPANENIIYPQLHSDSRKWPRNTDHKHHAMSNNKDICVICKLNVQRIVHHYVNEHRGCEVYNSRLTSSQIEHLKRGASKICNVSLYKNGQPQYEANCIFCQKLSKFMLPYWIHHFTMHTGEYAYRCSGCGIRKPTRSLLTQHISQGCHKKGSVQQDYTHDTKKIRVEARICTLCNYVQLHRQNIVKHLHQQHGIKLILPKHIQTILLLKMDESSTTQQSMNPTMWNMWQEREKPATGRQNSTFASSSLSGNTFIIDVDDDDDDDDNENDEAEDAHDDDTLLFGDTIQSTSEQQQQRQQRQHQQNDADNAQNYSYNYIPPYMRNASYSNINWEESGPSENLSYMICGMLDVQMNND